MELFSNKIKNRNSENTENCRGCTQNELALAKNQHYMLDPVK